MDMTALLLSRIQFAFIITFHITFPSFTIGLAAWLTVLETLCPAEDIRSGIRTGCRLSILNHKTTGRSTWSR
jgi:Cytochrome bd terminal oxidase subunit I